MPDRLIETRPSVQDGRVPHDSADLGTAWLNRPSGSVALAVPSVIVPEQNILINPNHTDFIEIRWHEPKQLIVDRRLVRRR